MQTIPEYIVQSIFFGFGVLIPISTLFLLRKNTKYESTLKGLIDAAITIVIPAGIVYLFLYLNWFYALNSRVSNTEYGFVNRLSGPLVWLYPSLNVLWTQLFWIKKVRTSKWARLILALLILPLMSSNQLVIMLTSWSRRDYLPSSWVMYYPTVWDMLLCLSAFVVLVVITYLVKKSRL